MNTNCSICGEGKGNPTDPCPTCYMRVCPTCKQPVYRDESYQSNGEHTMQHIRCNSRPSPRPAHMSRPR